MTESTVSNLKWNVIEEKEFKTRAISVFDQVAKTLTNTLGPYGSTTIIEKFGEMHITKDGWQILKKIAFDDTVEQNIMQLLVNISAQVVIKVGDGSTSSIVSANTILKNIEGNTNISHIRPKEQMTVLNKIVREITERIQSKSTKISIDTDPTLSQVHKLAMISTNGDAEISKMIQDIYVQTGNPFIEFDKSKSARHSYEIMQGYQSMVTYLDRIYATTDEGNCVIDNPIILMFDHQLTYEDHYVNIIQPVLGQAISENRRLVIIAPHYDRHLLEQIKQRTNQEYRASGTTTDVYARITLSNNLFHEQFNDFAILTGGRIIDETTVSNIINGLVDGTDSRQEILNDCIGQVTKITIGSSNTTITGFTNMNQHMYDIALKDAKAKFTKLEDTHKELNIVDTQLYELKKRIAKLAGRMGIIHIGGGSSLEKQSNYDLVEDAVKACESAYNYGYNIGGNLIIPITINEILKENKDITSDEKTFYKALYNAFAEVFTKVLANKYKDMTKGELMEYVERSIREEKCYDLIKDEYSNDIINPCHTDIEILKASTSIAMLLISSNQYISIKVDNQTV